MVGFQLCFNKRRREEAIAWYADRGYSRYVVDSGGGTQHGRPAATPVSQRLADSSPPPAAVAQAFTEAAAELDPELVKTIAQHLHRAPADQ